MYELDQVNENVIAKEQDVEITEEELGLLPVSLQKIVRKIESMKTIIVRQKKELLELNSEMRSLEKLVERHSLKTIRSIQKENNEPKTRKPSGFASPTQVSDALCDFMEKPRGSLISRTETSKFLSQYISKNKMQHPDNKKIIVPDNALIKLLGEDIQNMELNYFNIQKYITPHFKTTK